VLVANNNDEMQAFSVLRKKSRTVIPQRADEYAIVSKKDGTSYRQELYWGSSYLSQSTRTFSLSDQIRSVTFFDMNNKSRSAE
jgi:hypothetical protein